MQEVQEKALLERYSVYKNSGVEWLGKIPEHWEVKRLGSLLKPVSEKNKPELPLLSITRERGVIERNIEDEDENHNYIPDDLSGYKVLREGQFGMNKMKAWQGSYGISRYTGIVSPAYYVFDFFYEIDPDFFNIAIRSKKYVSFFGSASDGVRIGQWDLSKNRMKQIPFLLPPQHEQTAIANFLDDKCGKIDTAIAQKQQLIELLKERKQILIQNAVTKGLDPDVKMKDSGVEWIGEIPEHWEVTKLGACLFPISDKNYPELQLLSITREKGIIKRDMEDQESNHNFIPEDLSGYKRIKKGQFGMNKMKAWQGSYGVSSYTGIVSPAYYVFDILLDVEPDYFHLALRSKLYVAFFGKASDGVRIGQWDLSKMRMKRIPFVFPSKKEQKSVVEEVKNQTIQIEAAVKLQRQQITKLEEYKTSLIDAVVMGKIKVS